MNKQFDILKKTRKYLLEVINDLNIEQLNEIPEGFNNNISWNLGHMISTQQGVCYVRAGLPIFVDQKYFETYKPGTKPEAMVGSNELEILKQLFVSSIDQFETDYENNLFKNYIPWTTRYGIELSNIDELTAFLIYHEGLHLGYIMALKHALKK